MYSIAAAALTALLALSPASAAPAAPAPATRDVAPLEFTSALPEYFCANSRQTLTWRGGSGIYNLESQLHYQGRPDTNDKYTHLLTNSKDQRFEVSIGRVGSEFPTGSTYVFTLEDPSMSTGDLSTTAVPIYNC